MRIDRRANRVGGGAAGEASLWSPLVLRGWNLALPALIGTSVALLVLLLDPQLALAAQQAPDTCRGGSGGAGGQRILSGLARLVQFGGGAVAVVGAGGFLIAGLFKAGGSINAALQYRGTEAAVSAAIGIGIALIGTFAVQLLQWAFCGTG